MCGPAEFLATGSSWTAITFMRVVAHLSPCAPRSLLYARSLPVWGLFLFLFLLLPSWTLCANDSIGLFCSSLSLYAVVGVFQSLLVGESRLQGIMGLGEEGKERKGNDHDGCIVLD